MDFMKVQYVLLAREIDELEIIGDRSGFAIKLENSNGQQQQCQKINWILEMKTFAWRFHSAINPFCCKLKRGKELPLNALESTIIVS